MNDGSAIGRRGLLRFGALGALGLSAARIGQSAEAEGARQRVEIVTGAGSASLVLMELMNRLGFLREFGLDGHIVSVTDGSRSMQALTSGTSDICVGQGFAPVLPAIERGGKFKVLAAASFLPMSAVFSAKPQIRTVHDLVGKTIGVGSLGALDHELMVALLTKKNIDPAQVTFANIGASPDIFRAVAAGTVDAGPGTIDVYDRSQKYGVHALSDGLMWIELTDFTNQATFASEAAIAGKRDALVRTLAAYAKLYRYIQSPDSKEAFIAAESAAMGKPDPSEALTQWNFIQKYKPFAVDLAISEQRVRYMQTLNASVGIQKRVLPYGAVADMSLARDALKLLGA